MKRLRIRLVCDILKASSQRPSSLSRSVVIPSNSRNLSSSTNDIQSFPFGCRGRTVTPSSLMEKCNVIFVLGAPGSGKSTLCSQLAAYLDYQHLSAGELIRQEAGNPLSPHGKTVAEAIRVPGAFVPAEITVDLLQRAMQSSSRKEFLIDAFPVNMANLQAWNAKMASAAEIPCVLFLEVPMRLATERCLGRKRGDDTALGLEIALEVVHGPNAARWSSSTKRRASCAP
ncbi:UMP-CMP kinase 2-like [Paramacrobiotus metropolitanus]|uniref:UMP-CMP kinase 2-like n=1 Tax=Paramacrobiotus metropolitanus TaxID=2943436 RepID=UPI002445954D|nr:UMP-CMP kinase 2-like [Paramacrobiotus metropolitanus]